MHSDQEDPRLSTDERYCHWLTTGGTRAILSRMHETIHELTPTENVPEHTIADISHYPGDVALLNYLLQDLRVLMRRHRKGEIAVTPHQVFAWDVHGLERRTVLCDPTLIQDSATVKIVGFFGDRRIDPDNDQIDASEYDLIAEFENYPGILSYSSIELVDHYWANLVVHRQVQDREDWRGSDAHKHAVQHVAPSAYHGVRIHNGCIPDGVLGSETIVIESTKYWDYDSGDGWHGVRVLPEGAKETLDGDDEMIEAIDA